MQTVLDVIRKINSTQVVRGAIYDLLFTMCDRHLGNVFVDEEGNITLIDNDQASAHPSYEMEPWTSLMPLPDAGIRIDR